MISSEDLNKEIKNYDECLERGLEYQDFICAQLKIVPMSSKKNQVNFGETYAGIEIKYDALMQDTGNLFIETASIGKSGVKRKSGIFTCDNSYLYLIGNYDVSFIFSKRRLIALPFSGIREIKFRYSEFRDGFTLPVSIAPIYAEHILHWKRDSQANLKPIDCKQRNAG